MRKSKALQLVNELYDNSSKFYDNGNSYQLLQEYFNGYPIDTLIPLLSHKDPWIKRVAVWIVSELGIKGFSLIDDVIPLLYDDDRYVIYHALEIITVCSVRENIKNFPIVVPFIESNDDVIRILAMRLISNADSEQLQAGMVFFDSKDSSHQLHYEGLLKLLDFNQLTHKEVFFMINNREPLIRKYGIMVAKKLFKKFPNLIIDAMSNTDPDISTFSKEVIEIYSDL